MEFLGVYNRKTIDKLLVYDTNRSLLGSTIGSKSVVYSSKIKQKTGYTKNSNPSYRPYTTSTMKESNRLGVRPSRPKTVAGTRKEEVDTPSRFSVRKKQTTRNQEHRPGTSCQDRFKLGPSRPMTSTGLCRLRNTKSRCINNQEMNHKNVQDWRIEDIDRWDVEADSDKSSEHVKLDYMEKVVEVDGKVDVGLVVESDDKQNLDAFHIKNVKLDWNNSLLRIGNLKMMVLRKRKFVKKKLDAAPLRVLVELNDALVKEKNVIHGSTEKLTHIKNENVVVESHFMAKMKELELPCQDSKVVETQTLSKHEQAELWMQYSVDAEQKGLYRKALWYTSKCILYDASWVRPRMVRGRVETKLGLWYMFTNDGELLNKRNRSKAIVDFTVAIRNDEKSVDAYFLRADIFNTVMDYENALNDIEHVLDLEVNHESAWKLQIDIYVAQGKINKSIELMSSRIVLRSKDWHGYYGRAKLYIRILPQASTSIAMSYLDAALEDFFTALKMGCNKVHCIERMGDALLAKRIYTNSVNSILSWIIQLKALLSSSYTFRNKISFHQTLKPYLIVLLQKLNLIVGDVAALKSLPSTQALQLNSYGPAILYDACYSLTINSTKQNREIIQSKLQSRISDASNNVGNWLILGTLCSQKQDFAKSVQYFTKTLDIDPTQSQIWAELAKATFSQGNAYEQTIKACDAAIALDHTRLNMLFLKGEASQLSNRCESKTLRIFLKASLIEPTDAVAHLYQARSLAIMEKPTAALKAFLRHAVLNNLKITNIQVDFILYGRAHSILGIHERAIENFKHAIASAPSVEAICLLTETLYDSGDFDGANATIASIDQMGDIEDARSYLALSRCFASMGHIEKAIFALDKAIAMDGEDMNYRYRRGCLRIEIYKKYCAVKDGKRFKLKKSKLRRMGIQTRNASISYTYSTSNMQKCYTAALKDFASCIEMNKKFVDAYIARAELHELAGEFSKAFLEYEKSSKAQSTSSKAFVNSGILHTKFKSFAQAILCYDKGILCDPNCAIAYYNRGVAYCHMGQLYQATLDYSKCIGLDSTNMDAIRNRGIAFCQLGQYKKAMEDLVKCNRERDILSVLAHCEIQLNDFEGATMHMKELKMQYPKDARYQADIGALYIAQAESTIDSAAYPKDSNHKSHYFEKAKRCYLKILYSAPTDIGSLLGLAYILAREQHYLLSIRIYTQLLVVFEGSLVEKHVMSYICAMEGRAFVYHAMGKPSLAHEDVAQAFMLCITSDSYIRDRYLRVSKHSIPTLASPTNLLDEKLHSLPNQPKATEKIDVLSNNPSSFFMEVLRRARSSTLPHIGLLDETSRIASRLQTLEGQFFQHEGNIPRATQHYRIAIELNPFNIQALQHSSNLFILQRHYDQAKTLLHRILSLSPHHPAALLSYSYILLHNAQYASCLTTLHELLTICPDCAQGWGNRGVCYELLSDVKNAKLNYEAAIALAPSNLSLHLRYATILGRCNHLHLAMQHFATALYLES